MELLAPAGNMEQARTAIENGCNALYGGIKQWSARNRAQNFTIEEYRDLIQFCHRNDVKFYLTLNTLLRQKELDELKEVIMDPDFPVPDAVLVADLGIIDFLTEKRPDIQLHASTQFGAYVSEDIRYLETRGISRAVLARELTLTEIRRIREETEMELEVFVYGAQCFSFSGNCLWGGLLHLGSGNRGRCTGMCDDLYTDSEGRTGCFLHMRPIGLFHTIRDLKAAGVDSVKIEGRLRPPAEVGEVVRKVRLAINEGIGEDTDQYSGFLGGHLPVKRMLVGDSKGKHGRVVFHNPVNFNLNNIRLRMMYEEDRLVGIDYVSSHGERRILGFTKRSFQKSSVEEIYVLCRSIISANIYEFISERDKQEQVYFDKEEVIGTLKAIDRDSINLPDQRTLIDNTPLPDDYLMTDDAKDVRTYSKRGFRRFIFIIRNICELKECISIEDGSHEQEVIYQLPYLNFDLPEKNILELLRDRNVMITRISQIHYIDMYDFKTVYADYMLNIWNSDGAKYLESCRIKGLVGHPELPMEELIKIHENSDLEILYIARGSIPLGFTRACVSVNKQCDGNCSDNASVFENVNKGNKVVFRCSNEMGYRVLLSDNLFDYPYSAEPSMKRVYSLAGLSESRKRMVMDGTGSDTFIHIYRSVN